MSTSSTYLEGPVTRGWRITSLGTYTLLSALVVLLFCASPALAQTIHHVPGDYATIQAAIDAAVDGDTVVVAVGTYPENINFLGKAITVRSTDPDDDAVVDATIIDGQQSGTVVTFDSGEGPDSVLRGLTITNGRTYGYDQGAGIQCRGASPTIEKNLIVANVADRYGAGISTYSGSAPVIRHNRIIENTVLGWGASCIFVTAGGPAPVVIDNNVFTNNRGSGGPTLVQHGSPIHVWHSSSAIITRNFFSGNVSPGHAGGILCGWVADVDIIGNVVEDNQARNGGGMVVLAVTGVARIEGNQIRRNTAVFAGGLHLTNGTFIVEGNEITDNVASGGGVGGIAVQSADATLRLNTIERNTDLTQWIGGIWCSNSNVAILQNTITFNQGSGLKVGTSSVEIIGNVIEDNRSGSGGGIRVQSPTGLVRIEGNQIRRNTAEFAGGLQLTRGTFIVEGNEITDNVASLLVGGIAVESAHATLRFNSIERNTDLGLLGWGQVGGVWCYDSTVAILGNTIATNVGVGVNVVVGTGVTIQGNSIFGNEGLGIDLGLRDGPTPNDPRDEDTGPNDLQNFPCILYATSDGGSTTISGYLDSTPGTTFTLDFYGNMVPDPSGYGEGETPIGSATVTTGDHGRVDFEVTFPVAVQRPALTTATATDPEGNTSEFSGQRALALLMAIDIKPGSDPNSINLGAEGVVPVAILTTPDFEAAWVDELTLTLSGSAVRLKGRSGQAGSMEDVDGDGYLDLVVLFYIHMLDLQEGAAEAVLAGSLLDGTPIIGYDWINVVP